MEMEHQYDEEDFDFGFGIEQSEHCELRDRIDGLEELLEWLIVLNSAVLACLAVCL